LDENGAQAARGSVNFILVPVPPTTIAGSGGEVFMSRQRLDTEKSVHLVTDVELAIFFSVLLLLIEVDYLSNYLVVFCSWVSNNCNTRITFIIVTTWKSKFSEKIIKIISCITIE